jgi:hypothetical protein
MYRLHESDDTSEAYSCTCSNFMVPGTEGNRGSRKASKPNIPMELPLRRFLCACPTHFSITETGLAIASLVKIQPAIVT